MGADAKNRAVLLVKEMLEPDTTEERGVEIFIELTELIPDPYCMDYIFQSDEFINSDGSFNYEKMIKKCFDDYEPNIIAL